eukprot:403350297
MFRTSMNITRDINHNFRSLEQKRIFEETLSSKNKIKKKIQLEPVNVSRIGYEETEKFIGLITGKKSTIQQDKSTQNETSFDFQKSQNYNPFNKTRTSLVQPSNRILYQSTDRNSQDYNFPETQLYNSKIGFGQNQNNQNHQQFQDYPVISSSKNILNQQDQVLRLMNPKILRVDELKNNRYKLNQILIDRQNQQQQLISLNNSRNQTQLSQSVDIGSSKQNLSKIQQPPQFKTKTSEKFFIPLQNQCEVKKLCSCGKQHKNIESMEKLNHQQDNKVNKQNDSSQSPLKTIQAKEVDTVNFHKNKGSLSPIPKTLNTIDTTTNSTQMKTFTNTRNSVGFATNSQLQYKSSSVSLRSLVTKNNNLSGNTSLANMSITKFENIPKPPRFTLSDLPKYSRTLKSKQYDALKLTSVLGGKYYKPQAEPLSPPKSPSRIIEWSKTPVYKQFVLKLNEMDSLEDSQIGFRKYKAQNKYRTQHEFDLDLKNKKLMRDLLSKTLGNIYSESEVQYFITLLKKKTLTQEQVFEISNKVTDTLEVLMCKLGLKEQFQNLISTYDQELKASQNNDINPHIILKELFRCKQMYQSLTQIETIFKLVRVRDNLEKQIEEIEVFRNNLPDQDSQQKVIKNPIALNYDLPLIKGYKELPKEQRDQLEECIALYCFQSSRLFIQITQFLVESQLFKRVKFQFKGDNLQLKIRDQLQALKKKYEWEFGDEKIPVMDENGKLIFSNEQN